MAKVYRDSRFYFFIIPFLLTLSVLAVTFRPVQATDITVDETTCTLREAIDSANNDTAAGSGCIDGSGDDTIILGTDVILEAALPEIISPIIIEGQGHTIDGNNGSWSVLTVLNNGRLSLKKTLITRGHLTIVATGGAGIKNLSGIVTLTESVVKENKADQNGGGGIYNNGTLVMISSTVSGNTADYTGGGIYNNGTLVMISSTVSGNSASTNGGGILNDGGTVTLSNSTVSGNRAKSGGGIDTQAGLENSGTLTLKNSTVTENSSKEKGGGISNAFGTVTLINSVISGNSALTGGEEVYNFGIPEQSIIHAHAFNVFGDSSKSTAQAFDGFTPGSNDLTATSDGTNPTALSAILSPLANNGGPTQTHALVPGSPALDLDAACSTGLTTDQRGYPRPGTEGTKCDAGAFESSVEPTTNNSGTTFFPAVYLLLLGS
ncbi:Polymorphic outer membrane protein repeat-containing protein [Candidatus Electrothrix gigas]